MMLAAHVLRESREIVMDTASTHYTVLARRFRPQTFAEVIGQQHVAQALQNAIRGERVAHAYLFTGARGVGKTSMARILGKALNCPNAQDGIPCNECEICQGISSGNDVDVMELDGASNNGVDHIRSLRANVNVMSMRTKFKMYIIDEVHMLSKSAFNALLKTLEEPPPNVKFVFCTTEAHRLPDTILSRCQRFDFASIASQSIIERLHQIAQAEGYEVEPAALELVARRAAGSLRDSQSLFDQLLAFGSDTITAADVHRLLGTAADDRLLALFDDLVERRGDAALTSLDQALADGVQLGEFVDQWIAYCRDLMVIAAGASDVSLSSVAESARETLTRHAESWGLQTAVAAMDILAEAKARMQWVTYGRALAELGLIRVALLDDLEQLDALIHQLKTGQLPAPAPPRDSKPRQAAPQPRPASQPSTPPPNVPQQVSEPQVTPPPTESNPPAEPAAQNSTVTTASPPQIELKAGCEDGLWTQLVSSIKDATRDHVRVASGVAIIGPNNLEISFPASYHFSKQFCERPETLAQLEAIILQLTGQSVRISLRLLQESPAESQTEADQPGETSSVADLSAVDDPFVVQAISVFGGTVVKVEGLGGSAGTSSQNAGDNDKD